MDNFIHWYYDPECQNFIKELLEETNKRSDSYYYSPTKWENHSYHNDACGSICFNYDNDAETYVQFYAFHNEKEAKREGIKERYSVITMINGQEFDNSDYCITNNREKAIRYALESVSALLTEV